MSNFATAEHIQDPASSGSDSSSDHTTPAKGWIGLIIERVQRACTGMGLDLAISILFTGAMLRWSASFYRLFFYPMFDDNMYLWKSLEYVDYLKDHGLIAFIRYYAISPAHGPLTNLIGMAGYLLIGRYTWAPYVICGLLVLAFLRIARAMMPSVPAFWRLCMVATLMSAPVIAYLVIEFRPDQSWGLALAATLIAIAGNPLVNARYPRYLLIGTLMGIALIAKTSTYPSTIGYCGLAVLLRWGIDLWVLHLPWKFSRLVGMSLITLLPVALIAGPHYMVAINTINYYIRITLNGPNTENWTRPGLWNNLTYFFTTDSFGGNFGLGTLSGVFLALAAIVLTTTWLAVSNRQVRSTSLLLFALLLITWGLPTAMRVKNPYLGSGFYFMLLLVTAWHFNQLFAAFKTRQLITTTLGIVALAFAITAWTCREMPVKLVRGASPSSYELERNRVMADLLEVLRPLWRQNDNLVVMMPLGGNIINQTTLAYMALQMDHVTLRTMPEFYKDDPQTAAQMVMQMQDANMVITCDPFNQEIYSDFESVTRLGNNLAAQQPWLVEIGKSRAHGNTWFHVYTNIRTSKFQSGFEGYDSATGLESIVYGPFPDLKLPAMHRSQGPATELKIHRDAAGTMAVVLNGFAVDPSTTVTVRLNGQQIQQWTYPETGIPEEHRFPIDVVAGDNTLTIEYSRHRILPDDQSSVHWQTIRIMSVSLNPTTQPGSGK